MTEIEKVVARALIGSLPFDGAEQATARVVLAALREAGYVVASEYQDAASRDDLVRQQGWLVAERDALQAKLDAAETIIGKLQNLVIDVHGWVSCGCSETATAAMKSAMFYGWAEMGWSAYCDEKYKPRSPPSTPR